MKQPGSLQQIDRTSVIYNGRKHAFFAGCDYFRLTSHPEILRAIEKGLKQYGLSVAASRVTTGNHALYGELESALAKFFGAPAALVVSTGYLTNLIVAQTLRGDFTHVLIDEKAHVSLGDASQLFHCPVIKFKNRDVAQIRQILSKLGRGAKVILLTDGVYTYEGQVAPLREYLKALGPKGMILVDDAHGAGIVGKNGRGAVEFEKVPRRQIIQTTTLNKAFGCYGGAILCSRELRDRMAAKSVMFAGSTPAPLPLMAGALRALELLRKDAGFRRRLNQNAKYIKSALVKAGFPVAQTSVPVVGLHPPDADAMRKRLLARGIYPSFIIYPGGPPGGYLRIVISSEHTRAQLDNLLDAIGVNK